MTSVLCIVREFRIGQVKTMQRKIFSVVVILISLLLISTNVLNVIASPERFARKETSQIFENSVDKTNELIKIVILDTRDNKIIDKYITSDVYNKIFEEYNPENKLFSLDDYVNNNLNILVDTNIISLEKSKELRNDLNILNKGVNGIRNILPLKFDAFNIFNGILFKLEGKKISSIFDMNILDYPILNTNITALFSGLSSFEGSGFIFSIGFFGIQNIIEYSFIGQPHFPEIKGSIMGFTGILIVSRGIIGSGSGDLNILGIGMDILTHWNRA